MLVYVHGGGFVMGDKTSPGSPFYDNIGQWAAQQGYIGVTLTYRLAPANHWPCGPEDMALAVRWLRANIAAQGGDPEKIFLLGQSAGAVHVAAYTAHPQFHGEGGAGIAGALMTSGIYDPTTQPPSQFSLAYYGDSPATLAAGALHGGPAGNEGAAAVQRQRTGSDGLPGTGGADSPRPGMPREGTIAPMEYMAGHNHLSPAQCIGSGEDDLGPRISRFIAMSAGGRSRSRAQRAAGERVEHRGHCIGQHAQRQRANQATARGGRAGLCHARRHGAGPAHGQVLLLRE